MSRDHVFGLFLLIVFAAVGTILTLLFTPFLDLAPIGAAPSGFTTTLPPLPEPIAYLPPRPNQAPEPLREAVALGELILTDTPKVVPANVGNGLACRDCHFNGGLTRGGRNGGISLVGVAAKYPVERTGPAQTMDLAARINECFRRNLAGAPLLPESREMRALLAYFQWISKGIPVYAQVPWLKVDALPVAAPGTPAALAGGAGNGKAVFAQRCAMCHGGDGAGTTLAPPVWGQRSFTRASELMRPEMLAAFVFDNMPRGNPLLKPDEARAAAAWLLAQPRPDAPAE